MAESGKLTALAVKRAKDKPGMHGDGGGLYLQVKNGGASWVLRYQIAGRPRYMGLGPLALYGLAEARAKAVEARRLRHEGKDPIAHRQANIAAAALSAAKARTFKDCTADYIKAHRAGWRSAKHASQWGATLQAYAEPVIGDLAVQAIDTALVLTALEPIWTTKPETASRLRGRIEAILDWARVRGYRDGENPARWRGHLDKLLPARGRVRAVVHHAALPYAGVPAFMAALRTKDGTAARALDFAILVAARTGEVTGARWAEIDMAAKVWNVPAERMKAGKDHRVPLSSAALRIISGMAAAAGARRSEGEFVFPGAGEKSPLSNMAMTQLLRRMGRRDITVHGFRSSFRDWAAERTGFAREVAESALAHAISDKVEAAYRRSDLFEKRRRLMDAWAIYCAQMPNQQAKNNVALLRG